MSMPVPRISPAVRLSFGLVLFTLSVLLIIDMFGIIPKRSDMVLDARKRVSESMAVQLSVAASANNQDLVEATLQSFVKRNNDVVAAAMTRASGDIVATYGEFTNAAYLRASEEVSLEDLVFIPIYAGTERWGTINVEFAPVYAGGLWGYFRQSILGMLTIVAFSCLVGYMFILRKALRFLNPKEVVPERVRSAFNTLSEGVLIVDSKEQIMMANDAFARQVDRDAGELLGVKASSLKWKLRKSSGEDKLPWIKSIEEGEKKVGVPVNLSTPHMGVRAMSANSAPILDDAGKTRGSLVTFDDITDVEESNVLLENAVTTLQKNDAEIRRKNVQLEVLASRDALTGCYNRRAFFDILEDLFIQAVKTNTDLAAVMVDIDHFKSINDRFGHSVGDEAIRAVADILNACEYDGAVVGRYGGEEFCVALPNADLDKGHEVAEILRKQVRQASNLFSEKELTITASFGVSNADAYMNSVSDLVEHADKALYIAKESGRNRVVAWIEGNEHAIEQQYNAAERDAKGRQIEHESQIDESQAGVRALNRRIQQLESELKARDQEYTKNRSNDPVTDLPTRIIFEDRVSQAMAYTARNKNIMAVAIMNINMFSRINNTLGQVVGDEFLRAVGQRLKTILRRSDTVAAMVTPGQSGPSISRLHDDEFALLLTGIDSVESVIYIIKRIQDRFAGKIVVADNELYVTTTIGLSLYPNDASTPRALIENARSAQKHAKSMVGKNNYQFYSMEMNLASKQQIQLEVDMHNAIEGEQFRMVYQPKLDLKTGRIFSMEALIRWDHPDKGLVVPYQFIPTAEKSGLIIDIGAWSLNAVCRQTRKWVDMGAADLRVSVNISGIEFADEAFVNTVKHALKQNKLPASHLELEITESAVMDNLEKAAEIIEELRYMGVTIAMDDFGTGYSSFSYLGSLSFDWIKIDRNFLIDAARNKHSRSLYEGMVAMAHEIELKVVSEGIEKQNEYDFVKSLGVEEIQGYMISKPVDALDAERILFSEKARRKLVG